MGLFPTDMHNEVQPQPNNWKHSVTKCVCCDKILVDGKPLPVLVDCVAGIRIGCTTVSFAALKEIYAQAMKISKCSEYHRGT